jgi:hypothetical protein
MASIYRDPSSGVFRILFHFGKPPRQFHKSLDTTDAKTAEAAKGRIESTLQAIEQGWLTIPPNADFWQFVFSGGKLANKPSVADLLTLEGLFEKYEQEMPAGTMEANSLATCQLHKKHLLRPGCSNDRHLFMAPSLSFPPASCPSFPGRWPTRILRWQER